MSTPKKPTRKTDPVPPPPALLSKILGWLLLARKFLRALPILGFLAQHWLLLLIFALVVTLIIFKVFYAVAGVFVWTLGLTLGAMIVGLFLRNVFNRQTTDADCDSGWFVEHWKKLDPDRRVTLIVIERLVYFLGACIALGFLANRQ